MATSTETTPANELEVIRLGSGTVYVTEFLGEIPEDSEIEKNTNILGRIQGGASVEYKPTFYTAKDDSGLASKTVITEEEATLKTGLITFNAHTLAKMAATARVTETSTERTLKIGGAGNDNGKKYLFRFLHADKVDGDVRLTLVGRNTAGFSLAYAKDKETIIDAEIKAEPCDGEGTLVIYNEEIKTDGVVA